MCRHARQCFLGLGSWASMRGSPDITFASPALTATSYSSRGKLSPENIHLERLSL